MSERRAVPRRAARPPRLPLPDMLARARSGAPAGPCGACGGETRWGADRYHVYWTCGCGDRVVVADRVADKQKKSLSRRYYL